jgi:hypothetical protein
VRVAEFSWTTAPPTSVDEQLVLYDDGTAWLVVRRPRVPSPTIGSYMTRPSDADYALLAEAGQGPHTIDLMAHGQPLERFFPALDRVCAQALEAPEATATFHGRSTGLVVGASDLALVVVGAGTRAVEFELDPTRCAVHFSANGQVVGWLEFPDLQTGFISADASGLGGLYRAAVVPPGAYGLVSLDVAPLAGADSVSLQVAGWLESALPDDSGEAPFEVMTELARLSS